MHKKKVLIVEDYLITALDLKTTLHNFGLIVSDVAKSGEEAIEKAEKYKPDLILMDIMLNGYYTGIEAADYIRKNTAVPIIFLTALSDDETYLNAYNTKPTAILHKPFNNEQLRNAINTAFIKEELLHD